MFKDILNGITDALISYFGEDINIYSEFIAQGFEEPCFFISLLDSHKYYRLDNRYNFDYLINVRYHNSNFGYDDLNDIGENVLDALENISANSCILRTSTNEFLIQDGVLHCNVLYRVEAVKPVIKESKMANLNVKVGI